MLASLIAERYAKALLRAAQAEKVLDQVGAQAEGLRLALDSAEGVRDFLSDPVSEQSAKLDLLTGALGGSVHPILRAFLQAMLVQKRERYLPATLLAFSRMRDESEGRTSARFGTARDLPAGERKVLEDALSRRLGRTVTLEPYTDRRLLGGAVLKLGDTVFDGSLRGRLDRLGRLLSEGPPDRPSGAPPKSAGGVAKTKSEAARPASRPDSGKGKASSRKEKMTPVKGAAKGAGGAASKASKPAAKVPGQASARPVAKSPARPVAKSPAKAAAPKKAVGKAAQAAPKKAANAAKKSKP